MKRLVTVAMLGLSGCGGSFFESKAPVSQVYVLAPAAPEEHETLAVDIAVGVPSAAPGLDTERIAVLRNGHELDYYASAMWGDSAPRIVQYFLITSMQRSKRFHSVTSEQARVAADYVLDVDLQDFQADYGAAPLPSAHAAVAVSLLRIKDRKLLGSWRISAAVPAAENRLGAVVSAFESAAQQIATQVAANTAESIAAK